MRCLDLHRLRRSTAALAAGALFGVAAAAGAQTTAVGLSTVRSQRFGNENLLGFYTPQGGDAFAAALAVGDFNGDGADDLASGIPFDNGLTTNPVTDSGTVIVRYGVVGSGLDTKPAGTVLRQSDDRDPAEPGDYYGYSLASCDFNGDDFDDLAVGVPFENYAGSTDAGAVQIHYGSASGIHTSGDAFYTQSTVGIAGDVEPGDAFGQVLACGDFNHDGYDDLAIGVPQEDFEDNDPASFDASKGMVDIIPGSALGLDPAHGSHLDQDVAGMNGTAETCDFFGEALAVGDFNADGFDDLAIGVSGEDDFEGQLQVVFGSPSGLNPADNVFWSQSFLGGTSESDDRFGEGLAAGDFDGDGADDLAVGAPTEDLGANNSIPDAGQVTVLYGAVGGFDRTRTQFFDQDVVLGAGTSEANDLFGWTFAAADFDHDGRDDLVIGHPHEFVSGTADGAATIMMGSSTGLTATRHRGIAAGYDGFPGDALQHQKALASALAAGDFDGDGHGDVALGAPYEDVGGTADVGTEMVLYGALFGDGVENGNTSLWSQTVSSPYTTTFNNLQVTAAAKLGPIASRVGIQLNLFSPTLQKPAASTYLRVGPEAGLADERTLQGTFFIDPQGLTMSSAANANSFQLMACTDALGSGAKTRLAFDLVRTATTWSIVGNFFNELTNALAFAGSGVIANAGDSAARNNRIEFSWTAGNPGHLTVWRTR
ncbi:MAG TPA: FG-GAP repeat protein, partial [Thermoanaerobaculia bacterium]|nr:FG-GAP repeat protein [Thermoanaerobaculia bacterium]